MTGTFIIIFILNLLFLVVLFGRKETCLNTLRLVHQNSQSRTRPAPAPARAAVSGVDYAQVLRRQTISVGW